MEAVYFATVTASTVGYGDLTPPDALWPRAFTIVLIFVGVLVVASRLTTAADLLFGEYERWARGWLRRMLPSDHNKTDETGRAIIESQYVFYPKNLLPSVTLNIALQLGSAYIFVAIEGWDYGSALYHCIVTATTVGYGDELITSPEGQGWAVVHILLSVSMLGFTITSVEELRQERDQETKRVAALNQRLTKSLLERVERHSAALRPYMKRDAAGVDELEFAICMAVELGMIDAKLLQPFIEQFRELDVQGDGRVGMNDLNLLLSLERQRKTSQAQAVERVAKLKIRARRFQHGSSSHCEIRTSTASFPVNGSQRASCNWQHALGHQDTAGLDDGVAKAPGDTAGLDNGVAKAPRAESEEALDNLEPSARGSHSGSGHRTPRTPQEGTSADVEAALALGHDEQCPSIPTCITTAQADALDSVTVFAPASAPSAQSPVVFAYAGGLSMDRVPSW